jgi:hypothetical protein
MCCDFVVEAKEKFGNTQTACCTHAYENDKPELLGWEWPF